MMYQFLLDATEPAKQIDPDFLSRLLTGGSVLLRGMCTVFAVLIIIWGCVALLRVFMYDLPRKRAEKKAQLAVPVEEAAPAEVLPETDDGELIAVLAAAIAAAESDGDNTKFRVVSFHRLNK